MIEEKILDIKYNGDYSFSIERSGENVRATYCGIFDRNTWEDFTVTAVVPFDVYVKEIDKLVSKGSCCIKGNEGYLKLKNGKDEMRVSLSGRGSSMSETGIDVKVEQFICGDKR